MKKVIEIYVDGACSGNPGAGGWGALLRYGVEEKELSGYAQSTTNNRMEMMAAIEALRALKSFKHTINIYTDSKYLKDGITLWLSSWKKKAWKNSKGQEVKNKDLWEAIDSIVQNRTINWHWVKGHSGHVENERVDILAKMALQRGIMANMEKIQKESVL